MRENSKLIMALGIFLIITIIILPSMVARNQKPESGLTIMADEGESINNTEILHMYTTDFLNIRRGPGTDFDKIVTIQPGEMVQVISMEGNWAKLVYGEVTGYSSLDYLVIEEID